MSEAQVLNTATEKFFVRNCASIKTISGKSKKGSKNHRDNQMLNMNSKG